MAEIECFDVNKLMSAIDDCVKVCAAVEKFCIANNIRDAEIETSIVDVICGRAFGLTADEVLGPVSPAYLKRVIHYANKVQA